MLKRSVPLGLIVPAQPVERGTPPAGPEWVHEIKHEIASAGAIGRAVPRGAPKPADLQRFFEIACAYGYWLGSPGICAVHDHPDMMAR
jgi:hypothetical protein